MSVTVPSGQGLTLTGDFTDALPTVPEAGQLVITDPSGAVQTFQFSDLSNPKPGVYTKVIAPILTGRWTYVFHSTAGVIAAPTAAFNVAPEDWTPTVDDVGRTLRARTINRSGNEQGTFTSSAGPVDDRTRPSAEDVAKIIEEETGALQGFVGYDLAPQLWPLAHTAALYRIAARIELEYWPEQIQSGRSPYEQLAADRDREEGRLISAVRATSGAGIAGGLAIGSMLTRPQAAVDSEKRVATSNVVPEDDFPPFTPGWPTGGAAGTIV